jgi:hypothetical protein
MLMIIDVLCLIIDALSLLPKRPVNANKAKSLSRSPSGGKPTPRRSPQLVANGP